LDVASFLAELLGELLLNLVLRVVLLPAFWLISTPVIFVVALFRSPPFWNQVASMYGSVTQAWLELLCYF
jgi:hypothetical protein